jgi:hypothetical protein
MICLHKALTLAASKLLTAVMAEQAPQSSPQSHEKVEVGQVVPSPNEPIPLIYFNGFKLNFGSGDITFTLRVDNQNMAALKGSYTVVKTLSQALSKLIDDFERITNHNVMTSQEVQNAIKASQ